MRLDFWNHPLVVSAFRVRFRGRTPGAGAVAWFLGLVSIGGILHYNFAADPTVSWIRIYFVILLAAETILGAVLAGMATFQSMHAEVVNRTLDYQRTAAIGPHEILVGKLIGEPAAAYLGVLAGFPLLVWCWAMGTVSLPAFLLVLVNIVTTVMLLGAIGLVHPLDTTSDKAKQTGRGFRAAIVFGMFFGSQFFFQTPALARSPLGQVFLGLLTPAVSIYGIWQGKPFDYWLDLFGLHVPYLIVTPLAQLAVVALVVHSLARRLVSPLAVPLSKPMAYGVLLALDAIGASLFAQLPALPARSPVAGYVLAHLVAALFLTMAITPGRESLKTWLWRYRGKKAMWKDLLWGERSENTGALLVFCLIGIATTVALVMPGIRSQITPAEVDQLWSDLPAMFAVSGVVLLAFGALYQFLISVGPTGGVSLLGIATVLIVVPHVAGAYLNNPTLMAASPSAQFAAWMFPQAPWVPLWPVLAMYAPIFAVAQFLIRQRIAQGGAAVDRRVRQMLAEG
ncbi:MAG: hypothetical protein HYX69_01825 [Planctomycetia bacterium]|nr:hypothetical protein [Planctomycetia bacterium]